MNTILVFQRLPLVIAAARKAKREWCCPNRLTLQTGPSTVDVRALHARRPGTWVPVDT